MSGGLGEQLRQALSVQGVVWPVSLPNVSRCQGRQGGAWAKNAATQAIRQSISRQACAKVYNFC
jgi:hypothetical protein